MKAIKDCRKHMMSGDIIVDNKMAAHVKFDLVASERKLAVEEVMILLAERAMQMFRTEPFHMNPLHGTDDPPEGTRHTLDLVFMTRVEFDGAMWAAYHEGWMNRDGEEGSAK